MERSKQSLIAAIVCIAILTLGAATSAKIIYVDDAANGLGDGSSWENAFVYLQDALALVRTIHLPVEIRVAQGIYTPDRGANQTGLKHGAPPRATFELVEGIVLKGGYAGVRGPDPNTRDVYGYRSTLSGDLLGNDVPTGSPKDLLDEPTRFDNCECVVTGMQLTAATVLDGFVITGGMDRGIPVRPDGRGGPGIRLTDGNPTITNCWLHGNCILVGDGGAILSYGSNPTVTNCIFSGNYASGGGAIATYGGDAKVINCTFYNNWAPGGGAICRRCTVFNCILWGDHPQEIGWDNFPPDITYSDVAGGWRGKGNVDADPCFVKVGYWTDPNNVDLPVDPNRPNAVWIEGDYHLKSQAGRWDPNEQRWVADDVSSPCIDAGDPNSPVGDEPQPNGGRINMGTYGGTAEASKSRLPRTFDQAYKDLLATIEGQSDEKPLISRKRGYLGFVMLQPGTQFAVDPDYRSTGEKAANWFLQQWRDLFANASAAVSFEVIRVSSATIHYQQKYAGLDIYGAQMIISVTRDGGVWCVTSDIQSDTSPLDTGRVSLTPSIDSVAAESNAIAFLAEQYPSTLLEARSPVLMIYAPSLLGEPGTMRLVWNMEVWDVDKSTVGQRMLVDAHDGAIVHTSPLIVN